MKTITLALVAITIAVLSSSTAQADVGSCYSLKPICFGTQQPVCVCDYSMNCMWGCR